MTRPLLWRARFRAALAAAVIGVQAAAGVTGSRTAVASQPGKNIGVLVALRPAPTP